MTPDLAIALIAALGLGLFGGWLAALRYAHPPRPPALSPADVAALKRAFTGLFAQFIDNTTTVVGGLQEDMQGLQEAIVRWRSGRRALRVRIRMRARSDARSSPARSCDRALCVGGRPPRFRIETRCRSWC